MGIEGCRDPSSILPPLHTLAPGLLCTPFLTSHLFFLSFPRSLLGEMGLSSFGLLVEVLMLHVTVLVPLDPAGNPSDIQLQAGCLLSPDS